MRVNFVTDFSGCAKDVPYISQMDRAVLYYKMCSCSLTSPIKVNTYFRSTNRQEGAGPARNFPGTRQLTVVGSFGSDGLVCSAICTR